MTHALERAAALVEERHDAIAAANAEDVRAANLDEGALDRLRLDDARIAALGAQLAELAALPPLERAEDAWELDNGLRVSVVRIPIGAVGANFEARPNVAVDVAGQLLKSLNGAVLRTGGAALRTVTVLVDEVLRPALAAAGLPPAAVGLVRSPDREGARILVSLPEVLPLVILRGSGETTAALAREAATHGVRTLAHAEGGGVLYIGAAADPAKAEALGRGEPRPARRVQPPQPPARRSRGDGRARPGARAARHRRARARTARPRVGERQRAHRVGHRARASTRSRRRSALANGETSGLAASIVTEDESAAKRFLTLYRGTAAFWNATTRFTDGFALTGSPETGINVDRVPGPRGPVTYRDLYLRQYRVVGDGTQHR